MTDNEAAREDDADGPLLFGRVLDGEGGARVIGWDEARDWKPATPGEIMWVHLCRNRAGVTEWLRDGLGLPEQKRSMELFCNEVRWSRRCAGSTSTRGPSRRT